MTVREARIILAADIARNIFPNNSFMRRAINDDAFIVGSSVKLPQSGAIPTAKRNRSTYPVSVVTRQDTVTSYDIDEYSTDASHIKYSDKIAATYDMSGNTTGDHSNVLMTKQAEGVAYNWSPTASTNIIRTTGAARVAIAKSATGNRKMIEGKNVLALKRKMDNDEIPEDGRILLLNSEMLNDLLAENDLLGTWELGQRLKALGALQQLYNFEIMMRSSVLRYTSSLGRVDLSADAPTLAATDHAGSLAWHPSFVRSAIAGVKTFIKLDDPVYQGDLFSAISYVGASVRYENRRGVYAIVEDSAA